MAAAHSCDHGCRRSPLSNRFTLWFSPSASADVVEAALRPLSVEQVVPGRVAVDAPALACVLGALRLRDRLCAAGMQPWVQLGGACVPGGGGHVGVVSASSELCVPLRALRWVPVDGRWVLLPERSNPHAAEGLARRFAQDSERSWTDLRSALPVPQRRGWLGLLDVGDWASAAGLPVVEITAPARVLGRVNAPVLSARQRSERAAWITRAQRAVPGEDAPTVVLCERRSHLPGDTMAAIAEAEAQGMVWVVEAPPSPTSQALSPEQALLVALVGGLGSDASVAVLHKAVPGGHDDGSVLAGLLADGVLVPLASGGLRVVDNTVFEQAAAEAGTSVLPGLEAWAERRGDRPGLVLALARAQGAQEQEATLAWLHTGVALRDWRAVLQLDRSRITNAGVVPCAALVVRAAVAEADAGVLPWIRERLRSGPPSTPLALLGVGLAAHPEVGDGAAFLELLSRATELDDDPHLMGQKCRWAAFQGNSHESARAETDLAALVLNRIHEGRFHGALADLVGVPATRLDSLGLQHAVHLILLLGLVSETSRARREVERVRRLAVRLERSDGVRVAGVLSVWLDVVTGEPSGPPPTEKPRGGGARLLSEVLRAEAYLGEGRSQRAVAVLGRLDPAGGSGLLEDAACGRAARLAATLAVQEELPPSELQRWLRVLRGRAQRSVLAGLRLLLAEGILSAKRGDRRGAERLSGALESAEARGLSMDVRWLRAVLAQHPALSAADRAVYSASAPATARRPRPPRGA